jgi:TRAP-type transport system periplasmic protein
MSARLLGWMIGCAITVALSGTALAQTHKLRLGHASSQESSQQVAVQKFADLVKERSKGGIEIQIFANSTLGPDQQMINLARGGSIDIVISGSSNFNGMVPATAALELPFLFRDSAHAYKVLDGKVGQDLLDELSKHGLKGLAYFENGWREMTNNRKPLLTPEDAKGLKIRSTPNPYHLQAFQLLGMNPAPMAIAELYSALETKAFDAQEHPLPVFWSSKFWEVQKYLTLTDHAYSPTVAVMNKAKFDKMPAGQQNVLIDSARDAVKFHREFNAKENARIIGELKKLGIQVVEKPDMAPFRKIVLGPVMKAYNDKNGPELLKAIEAE